MKNISFIHTKEIQYESNKIKQGNLSYKKYELFHSFAYSYVYKLRLTINKTKISNYIYIKIRQNYISILLFSMLDFLIHGVFLNVKNH